MDDLAITAIPISNPLFLSLTIQRVQHADSLRRRRTAEYRGAELVPPEVEDDSGAQSEIVLLVADRAAVEELRAQVLCLNDADADSAIHSAI